MNIVVFLLALLHGAQSHAAVPLNISCEALKTDPQMRGFGAAAVAGRATLLGDGLAQGNLSRLSYVSPGGETYDYAAEVNQPNPRVEYRAGDLLTIIEFNFSDSAGTLSSVYVTIKGDLEKFPNADRAVTKVTILEKSGSARKGEALCTVKAR
jgi:hypothetical protein